MSCIFAEGGEKLCSEFMRILPTNTNCNLIKARQMNTNPVSSHQEYLLPKKKGTDELAETAALIARRLKSLLEISRCCDVLSCETSNENPSVNTECILSFIFPQGYSSERIPMASVIYLENISVVWI